MLELMGREWLVEYVAMQYKKYEKEMIYRVYITESIKAYMKLDIGYWELLNKRDEEKDERDAEEIKQSFLDRLGGESIDGSG